jgi:hypothetical protein
MTALIIILSWLCGVASTLVIAAVIQSGRMRDEYGDSADDFDRTRESA